ncbi:MAG: ABC transporter permease [Blastocatellia bacterium]|nr:ABC transporter permease [Blastocatellia bacterium]
MNNLFQDLRYAIRMLRKRPGFTLVAALTLALGIGANATIFSFVDTLFYRPLPVSEPDRLVKVYSNKNGSGYRFFAWPEYTWFRDHTTSFESLAAHYSTAPLNVVADGDLREEEGAVVSANYFSLLGIRPALGRFFLPEEDTVPDRDPVAVIGFDLWQHRFGGDPAILDKQIKVNGTDFQIVGVAPENFRGVIVGTPNEVWIPSMMLRLGYRWCDGFKFDCTFLNVIGRLAPGRTLTEAQAELTALASQLATAYPATNEGRSVTLMPAIGIEPGGSGDLGFQMRLLMIAAGVLLLIACANVAGLLLVRGTARRKEIAVRLCVGASRAHLIRQLLTESLLLAMLGGALGLVISLWAKDLLLAFYTMSAGSHSVFYDLSLSPRVLAWSLALAAFTGLLSGLAPAIQATRHDLARALKDDGRAQSSRRNLLRDGLVVAQVALTLALLVSAGLLVRSSAHIRQGANFDPQNVAVMRLRPRLVGYSPEKAQIFTREVVRRFEALPGVQSVSLATATGLAWSYKATVSVGLPEQAAVRAEDGLEAQYHEIAPRFFETLKIPLIQGRDFDDGDSEGSPRVAIVNETLANRMWPDDSQLGRFLTVEKQQYQVVGIFKDAQLRNALEAPKPFLYVPYWQNNFEPQVDSRFVVRVTGDPLQMLPLLRREVMSVDHIVPVTEDKAMIEQVSAAYKPVLLTGSVLTCSGIIALFLCMIGLYSVLAFMVRQRTREIGIRMALGARATDVLRLVVGQGMKLTLTGMAIGLAASLTITRLIENLLYGVSATDPLTFSIVALSLTAVAIEACWLPARRATRVDPMVALRYE